MHITAEDVEIIQDNIPNELLEKTFVDLTRGTKKELEDDSQWVYYIFQNSNGYYLWGMNKPNLDYIERFGFDVSDYKLIDTCKGTIKKEYYKWNPETGTGRKDYI